MNSQNNQKKKIYLIAGEPSGDLLGSRLMKAMKAKYGNEVLFYGVGGETMEAEGLKSLFDISDLAVMGLSEVIPSIPKILGLIKQTVKNIEEIKPDVVITIDSWSFSSRIHKALRKKKLGVPQVHYVAPQVWAWKKKRARTMYKYIDLLLTLFPYEPKYFTPYNLQTEFVGHPVIESPVVHANAEEFRKKYNINPKERVVTVLPGSRKTEVSKLLPTFLETIKKLKAEEKDLFFVIPTVKTVAKQVKEMVKQSGEKILVVETQNDRYGAFRASSTAIAASGTVALELAICDVPHIIAYKVSPLTALLAKKFLKIQFVNLSNILLGREIVPELLQERCVPASICSYIKPFLNKEGEWYDRQMEGFKKVREILGQGEHTPSENAAEIIWNLINPRKE